MNQDLTVYLHDHLAGATFAIELLERLGKQDADHAAARTAMDLLPEIESDRGYLERLLRARGGEPKSLKNVASWVAERATRFKFNLSTPLGIFEAVEFLSLGTLGKLALWRALEAAAHGDPTCLGRLKTRAIDQHSSLELVRLRLASRLFHEWDKDAERVRDEQALIDWAQRHGIAISHRRFSDGKAGEFDGITVSMNAGYEAKERLYYAAHAIGSIVLWSRDREAVQRVFDELRQAKKQKSADVERFVAAIERYRQFEAESSEHAVWILQEIGAGSEILSFTNLMRADLEAMTQFHEVGQAPVWNEFFARWNREVATGERAVEAFPAKPVEDFRGVKIETQEILQRQS